MDSKLLRYWKAIDLFGVSPNLSFQGSGKSKSLFGGVTSILMFIYIMLAAIYSFQNMVFRKNPNTIISTGVGKESGIRLGQGHFNLAFSFINSFDGDVVTNTSVAVPQFFQFKLSKIDPKGVLLQKPELIEIPYEPCTENHFNGLFNIIGWCMKLDQTPEIGFVNDQVIFVVLRKCNETIDGVGHCLPSATIDDMFNRYQMLITWPGLFIDPGNYDQPITKKREFMIVSSSASLSKQAKIALQEYEFNTDSGILLSDMSSETHIGFENMQVDSTIDGKNELSALVYMNGRKQTYTRSYMKLQQALAGTISLVRVAFLVCAILVVPCTRVKYYQHLIEDVFSLKNPQAEGGQQNKKSSKVFPQLNSPKQYNSNAEEMNSTNAYFQFSMKQNSFSTKDQGNQSPIEESSPNSLLKKKSNFQISCSQSAIHDSLAEKVNENIQIHNLNDNFNLSAGLKEDQSEAKGEIQCDNGGQNENVTSSFQKQRSMNEVTLIDKQHNQSKDDKVDMNQHPSSVSLNVSSPTATTRPLTVTPKTRVSSHIFQPSLESSSQTIQIKRRNSDFAILAWLKQQTPFSNGYSKLQYKSGRKKVKDELCITRIMKKMKEIDRLKSLVLDEDQRVVFDNLPKPDVMAPLDIPNALERECIYHSKKMDYQEIQKRVSEICYNLKKRPQQCRINSKLIQWYEEGGSDY